MTEKELFMLDGCSPRDVDRHIKNGSTAYPIDEWIALHTPGNDNFEGFAIGEDVPTVEDIKNRKTEHYSYVEDDGNGFILEYVL